MSGYNYPGSLITPWLPVMYHGLLEELRGLLEVNLLLGAAAVFCSFLFCSSLFPPPSFLLPSLLSEFQMDYPDCKLQTLCCLPGPSVPSLLIP